MPKNNLTLTKSLEDTLREAFEAQARRLFEERKKVMIEEFGRQLDTEKDKIIAGTVLRISKYFNIEAMQDRVVITVMTQGDKNA